jgi:hypothetical protein
MSRHDLRPPAPDRDAPTMMRRFVTGFVALAGAAVFAQFPAFYGDYLQRLGGRLDQARVQVERLERAARAENMDLIGYVEVFLASARSPVHRQGNVMIEQIADFERLRGAAAALGRAPVLARPWRFAAHLDGELARATLGDFTPSLPLGLEGLLYAAAGLLAGLGLVGGARHAGPALRRRRRSAA